MRTHRNNNEILCNVIEIKYESFSNEFMNLQGGGGGEGGGASTSLRSTNPRP